MITLIYCWRKWRSPAVRVCKMKNVESLTEDQCYMWNTGEEKKTFNNDRTNAFRSAVIFFFSPKICFGTDRSLDFYNFTYTALFTVL